MLAPETKQAVAAEKLKEQVFQALGAASVCWVELPKSDFDATQCKKIGDELWQVIDATTAKLTEANDNLFKVARKHSVENTKLKASNKLLADMNNLLISKNAKRRLQEQLADQRPAPESIAIRDNSPGAWHEVTGYTPTPDVEKIAQEIKDLFARYGSGDYTPTFEEVTIIDEALPRLLAQTRAPLVAVLEDVRKFIAADQSPTFHGKVAYLAAIDAALTDTKK